MQSHARLASRIVHDYMHVEQNDLILICGGMRELELIEQLSIAVDRAVGHPVAMIASDQKVVDRLSGRGRARGVRPERPRWLDDVRGIIDLDSEREASSFRVRRSRRPGALRRAWDSVYRCPNRSHRVNWLCISYPSPERADRYGLDYNRLLDAYACALDIDVRSLTELGHKIASRLDGSKTIRVTSSSGTDLRLSLLGRSPHSDHRGIGGGGTGAVRTQLPCGELYYAPVESSVEGVAVFHRIAGSHGILEDVSVEIKGGRIVRVGGDDGEFGRWISSARGDSDRIGEFGIGLNPNVLTPTSDPALDCKLFGSVHLGLGDNRGFGGQNRSNLHLDLVIPGPSVEVDGAVLCADGRFSGVAG